MSERYRERGIRYSRTYVQHWTSHQVCWVAGTPAYRTFRDVPYSNTCYAYYDDRQTMSDLVGCRGCFNPVNQTKRESVLARTSRVVNKPSIPSWFPSAGFGEWVQYGTTMEGFGDACITFQGLLVSGTELPAPSFPGIDWANLVYQVGSQLDGRMVTGQNLLVDLCQISQTLGMFKNPFNVRKIPQELKSLTLRKLMKRTASGYLEYKFGWENVYRSVKQLSDVWSEVRRHRAYLEETVNSFVSLAARQSDTVNAPSTSLGVIGDYLHSQIVPKMSTVNRTACFSLDLRRTQVALHWSKLDQVLSRLGINDVALAIWDCVPYSFVVDWFTHLNRLVAQKSIDWGCYDIRRMGWSTKTTWYGYLQTEMHAYGWPTSTHLTGVTQPVRVQEKYVRTPGFPTGCSSVGLFGNLNKTQIAEGLALIVQRI